MGSKELRKSTYMALIGVVVAAVALGTATYAWFINNTAVGAEQLEFSAGASTALSIAVHKNGQKITTTTNQDKLDYKGLLTNGDIKTFLDRLKDGGDDAEIAGLKAVSTVSTAGFYANDGFNNEVKKVEKFKIIADGENNNYYLALPIWLKSTENVTIYLRDTTKVAVKDGDTVSQYFDRAILLGFSEVPGIKDGEENISQNLIYEPNEIADATQVPGRQSTTIGSDEDGQGVTSVDAQGEPAFAKQNRLIDNSLFINVPAGGGIPTKGGIAGIENKNGIINLEKENPKKMMIYLWVDGMDFDCVSGISGSTLQVALNFIGVKE